MITASQRENNLDALIIDYLDNHELSTRSFGHQLQVLQSWTLRKSTYRYYEYMIVDSLARLEETNVVYWNTTDQLYYKQA